MISLEQYNSPVRVLLLLVEANPEMTHELQYKVFNADIPAGHDVFVEGDRADAIALLISGLVQVYKIDETSREIQLYSLYGG